MKKDHKDEPEQEQLEEMPGTLPHFSLAILLLYGMNTGLSKLTHALDIQFPSALIGNPPTLPCATGPTPCRHNRFAMSRRALQAENLCPLAGSNNACIMRSVHCGSHAHSIALTQMLAFVQPEAIAGQPGLQRYCVSTLAGILCVDWCSPCFCPCLVFAAKAKRHHAVLLVFTTPSQPLSQWSNAVLSSVTGMFTIISSLAIIEKVSPAKAEKLVRWFDPAILWIQRWLGAFYVPALAVLPLTIQGIEGGSLHKAR